MITFIICAAGRGERVKSLDPQVPKPLLVVNGKSLLQWSLESLPYQSGDRVIVVGQAADQLTRTKPTLERGFPGLEFLELTAFTRGQLETAQMAVQLMWVHGPLAIFNSDTYFQARQLRSTMEGKMWEGLIPCAQRPGAEWSFCQATDGQNITQVTEKQRISDWCSVGFYYFAEADLFLHYSGLEMANTVGKECYVAPLYNRYIVDGRSIGLVQAEVFTPMGSDEQIRKATPSRSA